MHLRQVHMRMMMENQPMLKITFPGVLTELSWGPSPVQPCAQRVNAGGEVFLSVQSIVKEGWSGLSALINC